MEKKYCVGDQKIEERERNRTAIFMFFRENPASKQIDCAKVLGMNPVTINKHVKAIRSGWKPEMIDG